MAIGLNKVNERKRSVKTAEKATDAKAQEIPQAVERVPTERPWSERGLAKAGRSVKRERGTSAGLGFDQTWLEWTRLYSAAQPSHTVLTWLEEASHAERYFVEQAKLRIRQIRALTKSKRKDQP